MKAIIGTYQVYHQPFTTTKRALIIPWSLGVWHVVSSKALIGEIYLRYVWHLFWSDCVTNVLFSSEKYHSYGPLLRYYQSRHPEHEHIEVPLTSKCCAYKIHIAFIGNEMARRRAFLSQPPVSLFPRGLQHINDVNVWLLRCIFY